MQVCPKREVEEDLSYFRAGNDDQRPSCSARMRRDGSRPISRSEWGKMKAFILMVTWFYYGQPPATSQTVFTSMEACTAARDAVLQDAAKVRR